MYIYQYPHSAVTVDRVGFEPLPGEFALRAAQVFRFDRERYDRIRREGFGWVV